MTFIADYWFIWLIGFIFFGGIGLYNWVKGILKTGNTVLKALNLSAEAVSVISDSESSVSQKASQIQNRTAQELMNEGKSRIGGLIGAGVCLILAWLFGIVLILSIILNVIDYIKAPVA